MGREFKDKVTFRPGANKPKVKSDESDADFVKRMKGEPKPGVDYRSASLKIHPHVCARCGREFSGKNLRLLTVHHKDGDHFNNPPDGSNWENLCVYCHDDEHSRGDFADYVSTADNKGASGNKGDSVSSSEEKKSTLADLLNQAMKKK